MEDSEKFAFNWLCEVKGYNPENITFRHRDLQILIVLTVEDMKSSCYMKDTENMENLGKYFLEEYKD